MEGLHDFLREVNEARLWPILCVISGILLGPLVIAILKSKRTRSEKFLFTRKFLRVFWGTFLFSLFIFFTVTVFLMIYFKFDPFTERHIPTALAQYWNVVSLLSLISALPIAFVLTFVRRYSFLNENISEAK